MNICYQELQCVGFILKALNGKVKAVMWLQPSLVGVCRPELGEKGLNQGAPPPPLTHTERRPELGPQLGAHSRHSPPPGSSAPPLLRLPERTM